jgi:hypothetical protein
MKLEVRSQKSEAMILLLYFMLIITREKGKERELG